ncbi:MAG: hydrogenase nickel incorporation protein HypB [Candidatus Poribacteria bacterium]
MRVPLVTNILKANDAIANQNRKTFSDKNLLAINVISSPGAGKTTLIQKTITSLKDDLTIAVIEGDIQSTYDADRISETGAQVVQINTGGGCHLDANMVSNALTQLDLSAVDLLIIENVGNLVCPAEFDLGEHFKIMLLSVPEGDDKPLKYPLVFYESNALLINKIDLLPYVDCDIRKIKNEVVKINPQISIFEISCKTGQGLQGWYDWLKAKVREVKQN